MLSASSLMDEAASRAGSDDWGNGAFIPALTLLVQSCQRTASLTPGGWRVLRSVVLRHLRNRLGLAERLRRNPGLASTAVPAVVVTGLPRTGTTLIHNLLALDPELRALRLWEALRPFPALGPEGPGTTTLVEQADAWLANFYELAPDMRAIHALSAEGPEECDALLQNSFASQHLDDMFDAEDYSAWFANDPLDEAYRYFALQLAALSETALLEGSSGAERGAGTWVLKSPGHLGHLDALLGALPGAVVVHCHRNPLEAVPSYASLIRTVRAPHTERLDAAVVGRQALDRSCRAVRRALDVRNSGGDGPFLDLAYTGLVGDPLGVMTEVYERFGRPLRPALVARMEQWLDANPQHLHGPHPYAMGEFGLRTGEVSEAFASYLDRFGALLEAPAR